MTINMPDAPFIGEEHTDISNGVTYVWDGIKWTSIGSLNGAIGGGQLPPDHIGPLPPTNPEPGFLWFNNLEGRMYLYYDDGDSQQWVDITGT